MYGQAELFESKYFAMKKIVVVILVIVFSACDGTVPAVKPGEIKHIPFSTLYAVGTDSTILILDRDKGRVTDVIYRFK